MRGPQYWKMDEGVYTKGLPPYGTKLSPDFCFGHWQTQCRATYEAPVDPHVVLGGFPNGPAFRSFSADATSFVVTYPVDSSADNRWGAGWAAGVLIALSYSGTVLYSPLANCTFSLAYRESSFCMLLVRMRCYLLQGPSPFQPCCADMHARPCGCMLETHKVYR
jgi:hypothetical protein